MILRSHVAWALVATLLLAAFPAVAQEPEAAAPEATAPAPDRPAKPKPRPKPKPKPAAKPEPADGSKATATSPSAPPGAAPPPVTSPDVQQNPVAAEPQSRPQGGFAAPLVACDPGQAVKYDGPKEFSLWVTRAGSITIDNPLRPLTPDVTRVLQLVIGDKLATAYGRDLTALRRGASPGALESLLGGPIHWEASLGNLPDGFDIVSDSGAPLAQMRFKECGIAPATKAPPAPVARKDGKSRAKKAAADATGSPPPASLGRPPASLGATAPAQRPAAPQRPFNLPQGAIGE